MNPFRTAYRHLLVGLLAAGLSACATTGEDDSPTLPVAQQSSTLADGSVRVDTDNDEVAELWTSAERERQQDNDAAALEFLLQALEIEPGNALFWSRIAELQLDNDQAAQAENSAMKSNALARNNQALLYRNWLMIEHARDLRGDLLGVRSAHRRVQQYQYR